MVIMSFRFSKKKIAFIVGLFLFAITAVLFGGKLIGTVQQTAAHSKIKSEKSWGGPKKKGKNLSGLLAGRLRRNL